MENLAYSGSVSDLNKNERTVGLHQDRREQDYLCGLGSFKPAWIQRFATRKMYVIVYSIVGLVQSMYFAYFVAVSTTIEKQFKLRSQLTGVILIANEVSEIILSLVLSYFGNKGDRPKLVAAGMLCTSFSCFLAIVPHLLSDNEALPSVVSTVGRNDSSLCSGGVFPDQKIDCSSFQEVSSIPVILLFLSKFISGVGTTLYYSLGFAYMDDNSKQTHAPILIGFISSFRLLGPTIAYIMASGFLKTYVNIYDKPSFKPSDPQWIGAWWLGFTIIGGLLPILAFFLALFPKELPGQPKFGKAAEIKAIKPLEEVLDMKSFTITLKRLFSNRILMINNFAGVFRTFAFSGYISFLPKFLEQQFQQTASTASLINGVLTVVSMSSGFMLSGFVISRWKPRAFVLCIWSIVIGILFFSCFVAFSLMDCNRRPMFGETKIDGTIDVFNACNNACDCETTKFTPVCSKDGRMNFYSACHAGCQNYTVGEDNKKVYTDCVCISENGHNAEPIFPEASALVSEVTEQYGIATEGHCANDCFQMFLTYLVVSVILKFLTSTTWTSNILINFRCVEKEDKSVALGMGNFLTSLFGFIPGPIVFGVLIDQACILWRSDCARKGNCWLYDPYRFQMTLHLITGCCYLMATVFEGVLCWYIRDLDLYGDKKEEKDEASS